MDPLVVRFGAGAGGLGSGMGDLQRTVDAYGGHTLRSWTVGETGYALLDVSSFEEQIDEVFYSIPVEFQAGSPVLADEAWILRGGGLDEILPAELDYHIELPAFEAPHTMAVRPPRAVCGVCYRIGHRGPPCPDEQGA